MWIQCFGGFLKGLVMEDLIDRFTLECRMNKSGKLKTFKPNNIRKENYKFWKADSNVMVRDSILLSIILQSKC